MRNWAIKSPTPERVKLSRVEDEDRELTKKELNIIGLVASGLNNKDVASSIGVVETTLRNYLPNIYDKLGLSNRVELTMWFIKQNYEHHQGERRGNK